MNDEFLQILPKNDFSMHIFIDHIVSTFQMTEELYIHYVTMFTQYLWILQINVIICYLIYFVYFIVTYRYIDFHFLISKKADATCFTPLCSQT